MQKLEFVPYTMDFLNLSWKWLNDPEIKRLTNTPTITREIQLNWFQNLKNKPDYKVWGIEYDNERIGVVGIKNIYNSSGEYFGFIGEKKYWNKGNGKFLLDYIVLYAKQNKLNNVWLRVIKENFRAIKSYEKYGFECFSESDNELMMRLNIV